VPTWGGCSARPDPTPRQDAAGRQYDDAGFGVGGDGLDVREPAHEGRADGCVATSSSFRVRVLTPGHDGARLSERHGVGEPRDDGTKAAGSRERRRAVVIDTASAITRVAGLGICPKRPPAACP
jgi:hypothetical protein